MFFCKKGNNFFEIIFACLAISFAIIPVFHSISQTKINANTKKDLYFANLEAKNIVELIKANSKNSKFDIKELDINSFFEVDEKFSYALNAFDLENNNKILEINKDNFEQKNIYWEINKKFVEYKKDNFYEIIFEVIDQKIQILKGNEICTVIENKIFFDENLDLEEIKIRFNFFDKIQSFEAYFSNQNIKFISIDTFGIKNFDAKIEEEGLLSININEGILYEHKYFIVVNIYDKNSKKFLKRLGTII